MSAASAMAIPAEEQHAPNQRRTNTDSESLDDGYSPQCRIETSETQDHSEQAEQPREEVENESLTSLDQIAASTTNMNQSTALQEDPAFTNANIVSVQQQQQPTFSTAETSNNNITASTSTTTTTRQVFELYAPQSTLSTVSTFQTRSSNSRPTFACLYTKQKTQKRKVWKDGKLVLKNGWAKLYDAQAPLGAANSVLDTCEIGFTKLSEGVLIEAEHYLITIEGPWKATTTASTQQAAVAVNKNTRTPSESMQKIMKRKYQKPAFQQPPPLLSHEGNSSDNTWQRRKRPLQPGELVQQYYPRFHQQHDQQQQGFPGPMEFGNATQDFTLQDQARRPDQQTLDQHRQLQQQPYQQQQQSYQQQKQSNTPVTRLDNDFASYRNTHALNKHSHATTPSVSGFSVASSQISNYHGGHSDTQQPYITNNNAMNNNQQQQQYYQPQPANVPPDSFDNHLTKFSGSNLDRGLVPPQSRTVTGGTNPYNSNINNKINNKTQSRPNINASKGGLFSHGNNFNPTLFYGEDDDEEEEDEESLEKNVGIETRENNAPLLPAFPGTTTAVWGASTVVNNNNNNDNNDGTLHRNKHNKSNSTAGMLATNKNWNDDHAENHTKTLDTIMELRLDKNNNINSNDKLTTNDLLDLFGISSSVSNNNARASKSSQYNEHNSTQQNQDNNGGYSNMHAFTLPSPPPESSDEESS